MGSSAPPLQWTQQKREGDSRLGEGLEDLPMAERMKALNITTEEPQEGKKKLELKITIFTCTSSLATNQQLRS